MERLKKSTNDFKKVAFVGFWKNFKVDTSPFVKFIQDRFELEITDVEHADYVFYSVFSQEHWLVPDRCIKIFYTGEMITPDFNACDYAIGFDWLEYGDRFFRLPFYYRLPNINELMEEKHKQPLEEVLSKKTDFCSITISNTNRHPVFKQLYEIISLYKKVDSGGGWNNNIGKRVNDKLSFDLTHKFSIVCENCSHPGYTTEKLVQAFAANCIPIYWGDPEVTKVFNPKAFIEVKDLTSLDEVIERVKMIDNDDNLYKRMIKEPVYLDACLSKEVVINKFENYLSYIFNQPIDMAKRRNRVFWGDRYIKEKRIMYRWACPYRIVQKTVNKIKKNIIADTK